MAWRYVVLRHDGIADPHFDLMLETSSDGPLKTWRIAQWPPKDGAELTQLPDHRRRYLEYEGPIDGGRGRVRRIEVGTYEGIMQASGDWQLLMNRAAHPLIIRCSGENSHWTIARRTADDPK